MKKKWKNKFVILRTKNAGVHFGTLIERSKDGSRAILSTARRAWYWSGAASLSDMALNGVANPSNCKFPPAVDEIEVLGVIEIIPCSQKAQKSLMGVEPWTKH